MAADVEGQGGSEFWRSELERASLPADRYRRLNPLTRVVLPAACAAAVLLAPAAWGAVLAFIVVLSVSLIARIVPRALGFAGALAGLAWLVVGGLSLAAGREPGVVIVAAIDGAVRAGALALCVALLSMTTDLPALGLDLERRGLDHRRAFGIAAVLGAGPGVADRVRTISAAQQARGLRLGRGPVAHLRGAAPIWLPALVSSLAGLSERSLALESRAIGHSGRRELLWSPPDPAGERLGRWLLLVLVVILAVVRVTGRLG